MRLVAALTFGIALSPVLAASATPEACGAPTALSDGWPVASPAQLGLDPKLICTIGPRPRDLAGADFERCCCCPARGACLRGVFRRRRSGRRRRYAQRHGVASSVGELRKHGDRPRGANAHASTTSCSRRAHGRADLPPPVLRSVAPIFLKLPRCLWHLMVERSGDGTRALGRDSERRRCEGVR